MKRILPAIILAILIHWAFFEINPVWFTTVPVISREKLSSVTVSISYRKPEKKPEEVKKVIKKPEPVKPKPEKKEVKKKVQKQKKIIKVHKEPVPKAPEPEKAEVIEEVEEDIIETIEAVETVEEIVTKKPVQARKAVPLYRYNPPPVYPKTAKRRGYQGTVILEILVTIDGKVSDLRILESSGYGILDKAAKKSAEKWFFEPGYEGNKKVEMWVEVPVTFKLKTQ